MVRITDDFDGTGHGTIYEPAPPPVPPEPGTGGDNPSSDDNRQQWQEYRQQERERKARERELEKQRKEAEKEAKRKRRAQEREQEEKRREAERLQRVQESKKEEQRREAERLRKEQEKQKRRVEHIEGQRLLFGIDVKKIFGNIIDKIVSLKPDPNKERLSLSLNSPADQKYRHEIARLALENAIANEENMKLLPDEEKKKKLGHCYHFVKDTLSTQKIINIDSEINKAVWIKNKNDYLENAYRMAEILEKLTEKFIKIEIPPEFQGKSIKKINDRQIQDTQRNNANNWFEKHLPEGAIIVYGKSDEKFDRRDAKIYGHVAIVTKKLESGKIKTYEAYDQLTGFQDPRRYGEIRVFLPTKLKQDSTIIP